MGSHATLNVWTFSVKHILKLTCTEPYGNIFIVVFMSAFEIFK